MIFKGAIFDFNGTIIWDTSFHDKAFDIFLETHNVKLSKEQKRIKIHGKPNPDIMRGIFGNQLTDSEVNEFAQEKEQIYRDLIINDLQFAPGAVDLFNFLKQSGIPFSIATSADIENVNFYFEHMQLDRWFNFDSVTYNDGSFRGKPFPDIFMMAASKLGSEPHETIIFEDSVAGILAAEKADAGKIYIVNSYNDNYSQFPHEVITHFDAVDRNLFV